MTRVVKRLEFAEAEADFAKLSDKEKVKKYVDVSDRAAVLEEMLLALLDDVRTDSSLRVAIQNLLDVL